MAPKISTLHRAPRQLPAAREKELLDAARELFFTQGLASTSMDQVAQKTGISKATIYRRYSSKEEMFEAILLDAAKTLSQSFDQITLDENEPINSLTKAAKLILDMTVHSDWSNLLRQIIAEAHRNPKLSRKARDLLIQATSKKLAVFFERLIAKGNMQHDYPLQAAITFIAISSGSMRPLLNAFGSEEDEQKRMQADLKMFLVGCHIKNKKLTGKRDSKRQPST